MAVELKVSADAQNCIVTITVETPEFLSAYSFGTRDEVEAFINLLEMANQLAFSGIKKEATLKTRIEHDDSAA